MDCAARGGLVGLLGQSKCDNEPAILALAQEIRRPYQNLEAQHGDESEDRDWPVSSADTMDHGACRTAQEQVHGGRRRQNSDREMLRGRGVLRPVYELGEKVLFLPLAPARRGDFGARFDCGINLGCRSFDGQAYIGTPSE